MTGRLDPFLQPLEVVLYREPVGKDSWLEHVAHGFAIGLMGPLTNTSRGVLATVLTVLLVAVAHRATASPHGVGMAEAAVTTLRLLYIRGEGQSRELTEIAVDEVRAVEVLGRDVRVTKKDGRVVVLEGLDNAADLGLALAQSARVTAPWVPGRKERLAQEAAILAASTGGALAYALALDALGNEPLAWATLPSQVITLLLAGGIGVMGWGVGLLAGLALLRPYLTRGEMRAWMRQSALFAPKPQPGARTGRFARFYLWFVDQLYDPAAGSPPSPGEHHGR